LGNLHETLIRELELSPHHVLWRDDVAEYHTIKLHAEGRDAIKIAAAHLHRPDLPFPTQIPADCESDPAYAEAGAKGYLIGPIAAFDCSLILHGPFDGVSWAPSPLGEQVLMCSVDFLRAGLQFVSNGLWNGETRPVEWRRRGLMFARDSAQLSAQDGAVEANWDDEPAESLKGNAEFAFGVYSEILDFADQHRTAIAIW
jgi:hypothetical protein